MWARQPDLLHPLTELTSHEVNYKWTDVEQKAFDEIKRKVSRNTLLANPAFNKRFNIHTGAKYNQLGAVIIQECEPIAFLSLKLTYTQNRSTVTEKELLSTVEILKEFRTILLGQYLKIYTYYKNIS